MKKDCGTDFQMRIGINSGQVIVGTTVDDLRWNAPPRVKPQIWPSEWRAWPGPGRIQTLMNGFFVGGKFFADNLFDHAGFCS